MASPDSFPRIDAPGAETGGLVLGPGRLVGRITPDTLDLGIGVEYQVWAPLLGTTETPAELRVVGLDLPVRSWRQLAGLVVTFGENATSVSDGETVRWGGRGQVSLGARQFPLLLDRFELQPSPAVSAPGVATDLVATVSATAHEYMPKGGSTASWPLDLSVSITIGPVIVRLAPAEMSAEAARALAARYLDLDDYDASLVNGDFVLAPRQRA